MDSTARVAVFWDYENCRPPSTLTGSIVASRVLELARAFGRVTMFKAYLDLSVDSSSSKGKGMHSELQSSGISIIHCPHNGRKDVADKMMLVDMMAFAIDNVAPATFILISGDRDFAYGVSILRQRGYYVVGVVPAACSLSMKNCANECQTWHKVLKCTSEFPISPTETQSSGISDIELCLPSPSNRPYSEQETTQTSNIDATYLSLVNALELEDRGGPSWGLEGGDDLERGHLTAISTAISVVNGFAITECRDAQPQFASSQDSRLEADIPQKIATVNLSARHPSGVADTSTAKYHQNETPSKGVLLWTDLILKTPLAFEQQQSKATGSVENQTNASSFKSRVPASTPAIAFEPLIAILRRRSSNCESPQIHLAQVGLDLAGLDTCTYERLGVQGFEQYISRACAANVVQTSFDSHGHRLVELRLGAATDFGTPSAVTDMPIQKLGPDRNVCQFGDLIYYLTAPEPNGYARVKWPEIAAHLSKYDPGAYKRAGARNIREYLYLARDADIVLLGEGVDHTSHWAQLKVHSERIGTVPEGVAEPGGWELSPNLNSLRSTEFQCKPSITPLEPVVDPAFVPLLQVINSIFKAGSKQRCLRSMVGMQLIAQYPTIYKTSGYSRLANYLSMAERKGLVLLGKGTAPGSEWVELRVSE